METAIRGRSSSGSGWEIRSQESGPRRLVGATGV